MAAIELANRVVGADVIIVARGGGSLEDLWTFNEEAVVRTIATSRLAVVSAIGHEIDVTLADLASDKRALTPTEAGELCVPDACEVILHLDRLAERLRSSSLIHLSDARTVSTSLHNGPGTRSRKTSSPADTRSPESPPVSKPSVRSRSSLGDIA